MKLICPNCGSKYDSGKFCLACGSPLTEVVVKKVLFCPVCQTEETSGKFCTTCGAKLEEREIEITGDNYSKTTNTESSPVNDTQKDDEIEAIVAKYRDEYGNMRRLNPEEYPIAAGELQKCADKGNLEGMCYLAELHMEGLGVPEDYERAYSLFCEAESKGSKYANAALGMFYVFGIIVEQNLEEGIRRLVDGYNCTQIPSLAGFLSYCYRDQEDYKNALKYARLAADKGDKDGFKALGDLYFGGKGVEKDDKKAFDFYMQAAAQGEAISLNQIGWMYDNGCGIEKDPEQAFFWYNESAQKGNVVAMNNVAHCYRDGNGVKKDFEKAAEWFKKSADQGHVYSMIQLADYYEDVLVDFKKSKMWVEKAVAAGNAEAINRLGVIYLERELNYEEAVKCFDKAIELGVPNAYRNLALCYRDGNGVDKNLKKADELLTKASRLGIEDAEEIRAEMLKSSVDTVHPKDVINNEISSRANDFVSTKKNYEAKLEVTSDPGEKNPNTKAKLSKSSWVILSVGVLAIIIFSYIDNGALCMLPSMFVGIFLGIKTSSMLHPKHIFAKLVYSLIFPFAVFFIIFIVLTIPFELSGKSEALTSFAAGLFIVTIFVSIVYLIRLKVSK